MYELFIHQWKEQTRSPFWQKSIILNILLGFLNLVSMLMLVFISLFADKILLEVYKGCDVVEVLTGFLFYYFAFDLIVRFFAQKLPVVSIQPYLTLPIKKSKLLHYPLLKSATSFFNVFAVVLFLPFFIKNISATQSFQFSITWAITVLSFIAVNNFLNFSLKKYFSKKPLFALLLLASLGLIIYLDFAKIISFSSYFSQGIYYMSKNAYLIVLPISMPVLSYYFAYAFMKRNAYIEDSQNRTIKKSMGLSILGQFGEIGQLIGIEIKLIHRNKRPKSILYISCISLIYGLFLYKPENLDNYFIMSFMGIMLPSIFSINYGQFAFSWESSYFDSILTRKITPYNFIKSKFVFFSIVSILGYVLVLPYALISYKIAIINGAFLLFNIGIASIIVLFFSTFNSSYIDLGKGQYMNYQGTSARQFLVPISITVIPLLILVILKLFGGVDYYYYTIAFLGFLGIVLNKYLLQLIVSQLKKRKYSMALGFRQK